MIPSLFGLLAYFVICAVAMLNFVEFVFKIARRLDEYVSDCSGLMHAFHTFSINVTAITWVKGRFGALLCVLQTSLTSYQVTCNLSPF